MFRVYAVMPAAAVAQRLHHAPPGGDVGHRFSHLRIVGTLDLSKSSMPHPAVFEDCVFDGAPVFAETSFRSLALIRCQVIAPHELNARHLTVSDGDLNLEGFTGAVNLTGVHVRDDLHLEGASLAAVDGYALDLTGARLDGDLHFSESELRSSGNRRGIPERGFSALGPVLLDGAHIGGSVHARRARFHAGEGDFALRADVMSVGATFDGTGMWAEGPVQIAGVDIAGSLELLGACFDCMAGRHCGLVLDRAKVGGSVFCNEGFVCAGTLHAIGCQVGGSFYLEGASCASRERGRPAVELRRACIKGDLSLRSCCATIEPAQLSEPAARRCSGRRSVPFTSDGRVSLVATEVAGKVELELPHVSAKGPSTGPEAEAAVDLFRLRAGVLHIEGDSSEDSAGTQTTDAGGMDTGWGCFVDFTGARVGALWDDERVWSREGDVLDQFRYDEIRHVGVDPEHRLTWVRKGAKRSRKLNPDALGAPRYDNNLPPSPQPYEQLAAAYVASGMPKERRDVLYRKQRDRNQDWWHNRHKRPTNRVGLLPPRLRQYGVYFWNLLQEWLIGYGYLPGRAFSVLVLAWLLGVAAFYRDQPEAVGAHAGTGMSTVEHLTYPADLLVPLVGFSEKGAWHPQHSWAEVVATLLVVLGWVLGATVVAAVTRVVRRS